MWRRTSAITMTLTKEVRSHNAAEGSSMSKETIPHPSPRGVSARMIPSTTAGSPHTPLLCTNHQQSTKEEQDQGNLPPLMSNHLHQKILSPSQLPTPEKLDLGKRWGEGTGYRHNPSKFLHETRFIFNTRLKFIIGLDF